MAPARDRLDALGLAALDLDRGLEERFELASLQALVDLPGGKQGSDLRLPWCTAGARVRPNHIPKLLRREGLGERTEKTHAVLLRHYLDAADERMFQRADDDQRRGTVAPRHVAGALHALPTRHVAVREHYRI